MSDWWEKRLDDFWNGLLNTVWYMVLTAIFGGSATTAVVELSSSSGKHPHHWISVFIVSTLALLVVLLLAARRRRPLQQTTQIALTVTPTTAQETINNLYTSIDVNYRIIAENPIRAEARKIVDNNQREEYLTRALTLMFIMVDFEGIWYSIYASQIDALQLINTRGVKREDIFPYYTAAASAWIRLYSNYSFDQWLGYIRSQGPIVETADIISISWKGREFLRFLVGEGRSSRDKNY